MKQAIIFGSAAATVTTAAIFLFRQGRKKKRRSPVMTFNDLYYDNCPDGKEKTDEDHLL